MKSPSKPTIYVQPHIKQEDKPGLAVEVLHEERIP